VKFNKRKYKLFIKIGQVSNLVDKDTVIDGKVAKTFNSVAPAQDGKIYYTVSSTNYNLDESVGEMLGAPSGRLMVFNPETKENKVLLENIHFTNGILLSPDEDYIVFAECLRFRMHKYFISGPKAGKLNSKLIERLDLIKFLYFFFFQEQRKYFWMEFLVHRIISI
jgi:sugar lactone lactonase YvrE